MHDPQDRKAAASSAIRPSRPRATLSPGRIHLQMQPFEVNPVAQRLAPDVREECAMSEPAIKKMRIGASDWAPSAGVGRGSATTFRRGAQRRETESMAPCRCCLVTASVSGFNPQRRRTASQCPPSQGAAPRAMKVHRTRTGDWSLMSLSAREPELPPIFGAQASLERQLMSLGIDAESTRYAIR